MIQTFKSCGKLTPLKHSSWGGEPGDLGEDDLMEPLSRANLLTGSSSVSERLALLSELCNERGEIGIITKFIQ